MTLAGRLLRFPFIVIGSASVFVLLAGLLTCCAVLLAGYLAYATCCNALAADRGTHYIHAGITDLEHHLAKETGR